MILSITVPVKHCNVFPHKHNALVDMNTKILEQFHTTMLELYPKNSSEGWFLKYKNLVILWTSAPENYIISYLWL
jgi:hypothetical protein